MPGPGDKPRIKVTYTDSSYSVLHLGICISVSLIGTSCALADVVGVRHILARDAFVRTNRRAIAIMFVSLSVCFSGMACIVLIQCTLARI